MNAPIRIPASMNPLHNGHLEACKIISRETGSPLFIDIQTQADIEESFDLALRKQMVLDSFEGIIQGVSVGQSEIFDLDVKQYSGIALGSDQFNAFIKAVLQSPDPHPKRMKFLSFDMIFIVPRPDYPLVADWQEVLNTHGYASNIMHILPNSEISMSSTWLRARLRQSGVESVVDYVPKAVYNIIKGIQESSLAVPCERLFAQEIKQ